MTAKVIAAAAITVVLAACTLPPLAQPPASAPPAAAAAPAPPAGAVLRYRCDQDIAFTVLFDNGTAMIDAGRRGADMLLRDAGGVTPQQTVYSSTTMKAEFGLEPQGRGARLTYLSPPTEAKCARE